MNTGYLFFIKDMAKQRKRYLELENDEVESLGSNDTLFELVDKHEDLYENELDCDLDVEQVLSTIKTADEEYVGIYDEDEIEKEIVKLSDEEIKKIISRHIKEINDKFKSLQNRFNVERDGDDWLFESWDCVKGMIKEIYRYKEE
jgi:hypothetical protein